MTHIFFEIHVIPARVAAAVLIAVVAVAVFLMLRFKREA